MEESGNQDMEDMPPLDDIPFSLDEEPLDLEGIDLGADSGDDADDIQDLGDLGDDLGAGFELDPSDESGTGEFSDSADEPHTPASDDANFDEFSDDFPEHLNLELDDVGGESEPAALEEGFDSENAFTGTSFFDEDEDETVALSEDELEDILGSTEQSFFEDFEGEEETVEGEGAQSAPDSPFDLDDEDSEVELGEVLAADDLVPSPDLEPIRPYDRESDADFESPGGANDLSPGEELGFDDFHSDEPAATSDLPGFLDPGEDDEPIALSEDELDSIMGDVEPEETGASADSDFADFSDHADAGGENLDFESGEEDANITLSDDELSQVLLDSDGDESSASAASADWMDEELENPSLSSLDMDDDEPIALTAEELGNIVSEVEGDEVVEAEGFAPELDDDFLDSGEPGMVMEADTDLADSGDEAESFDSFDDADSAGEWDEYAQSDDDPVALSDSELGSILEDTDAEALSVDGETPPDEYDAAADDEFADGNVIVLDEYEDDGTGPAGEPVVEGPPEIDFEASFDEALEGDEAVADGLASRAERMAEESGLDREELRTMISYLDNLFDALPDDAVRQFSQSQYFDLYKKIMSELGL